MADRTANSNVFIYAITAVAQPGMHDVHGIDRGRVYCLNEAGMMAVVSSLDRGSARPNRRNIMAHQEVLRFMMHHSRAVLPMRFGVVAQTDDCVRELLSDNAAAIRGQLQRVDNRMEMGLRVAWNVDNIYEYFIATQPLLRQARDAAFAEAAGSLRRQQKIELGRVFYRLVTEERKRLADRITGLLDDCCDEIAVIPPKNDNEAVNLACLVVRQGQESFEQAVFEAAKHFDNNHIFNFTGPWAPHSFVDLELRMPAETALH